MKKILAALVTVFAVSLGSAIAAGPALADQQTYVPASPTRSSAAPVHYVVTPHGHPQVIFQTRTVGNAKRPHGTVRIVVVNGKGKVVKGSTGATTPGTRAGRTGCPRSRSTTRASTTPCGWSSRQGLPGSHDTAHFVVRRHR